jgi:hypothetical protein
MVSSSGFTSRPRNAVQKQVVLMGNYIVDVKVSMDCLNCQSVCDVGGRFLDMSILYPGSTSDGLAFEGMSLYHQLENGLLDKGLCLFGDNAYLNSVYMATPYTSASGSRDNYTFFHSQLRICIECVFGMFTQQWGIL